MPIADSVKLKGKVNIFHPGLVNLNGCAVSGTHPAPGYDYRNPQMTMADLELVVSTLKKATKPK